MIPTTQEIADQNLAGFEANLAQSSPLNDKAFLRVLAVVEALALTGLYKFGAERIRQNLAQTATGTDLDMLGNEPGVDTPRKLAESATVVVTLPASTGIIIPMTTSFIAAANGIRYGMDAEAIAVDDVATLTLTAETDGPMGNLSAGDVLNIVSQVAGAGTVATVTGATNTGTEEESDEDYRSRVMFAMQSVTGGSNATDHKTWAEEVGGVRRAYPYAGRPTGTSYPGDRTVYVESTIDVNPDGIPTVGLLAEVRTALGGGRPVLGLTDDSLWVEPITRSVVSLTVTNLVAPAGTEASVRTAIESAAASYMRAVHPYIEGVDVVHERNDTVTTPAVSQMVQDVLAATGSSAGGVTFTVGGVAKDTYTLGHGELAKLGTVTYATV